MRDPNDFETFYYAYKAEIGWSLAAFIMAAARAIHQGDPFRVIVSNAIMCGVLAFGFGQLLEAFGIAPDKFGYLASVTLGYVGVEVGFKGLINYLKGKFNV